MLFVLLYIFIYFILFIYCLFILYIFLLFCVYFFSLIGNSFLIVWIKRSMYVYYYIFVYRKYIYFNMFINYKFSQIISPFVYSIVVFFFFFFFFFFLFVNPTTFSIVLFVIKDLPHHKLVQVQSINVSSS